VVQEAPVRETYGKTLVELGKENPDIVVLDADLSPSTMTRFFAREFPDRFFDCGIAEQNMVGIAAGLAASGKIPFASTFAVFAPGRSFDQIRMSVAYSRLNVKLVSTHAGISVGEDGASHHSIEDLSLICSLPGFNVVVPADAIETAQAVRAAAAAEGPFYIRLCRSKVPIIYDDNYRFTLGKAVTLREGTKATIIAIGIMVSAALEAEAAIAKAAAETGAIVTAEDHLEHGGLGSIVSRVVARVQPVPMRFVALKDTFAKSGKASELLQRYGLTARDIEQAVREVVKKRG